MFQVMRIRLAALLMVASLMLVLAQSAAGGFVGIIRDSSGAAVSDAAVEVRNVETNLARQTRTGDQGGFVIANLPPGNYEVGGITWGQPACFLITYSTKYGNTRAVPMFNRNVKTSENHPSLDSKAQQHRE